MGGSSIFLSFKADKGHKPISPFVTFKTLFLQCNLGENGESFCQRTIGGQTGLGEKRDPS
jgi:hypothetical protein